MPIPRSSRFLAFFFLALFVLAPDARTAPTPPKGINIPAYGFANDPLPMVIRSAIPKALGRIDKAAFDPKRYVVFLAGTRANSVYAQSLVTHRLAANISDLPEPRALLWLDKPQLLVVACGGDGSVRVFKPQPATNPATGDTEAAGGIEYSQTQFIKLYGEADGLAFDPASTDDEHLFVFVTHAMSVRRVNIATGEKDVEIKLPGRADGLQPFMRDNKHLLAINIPKPEPTKDDPAPKSLLVIADPATGKILERIEIPDARANTALALDQNNNRLFVLTREPAKVIVYDLATSSETTRFDAPADADDIWYDIPTQRLFVIGGGDGGKIGIFERKGVGAPLDKSPKSADHNIDRFEEIHTASTAAGCRTAAYDADQRLLIAAAPALGPDPIFFYVYLVGP